MATPTEIGQTLALLARCYPRYQLEKDTVIVYAKLLADLPADELKAATLELATSLKFFPSVAEIREMAAQLRRQAAGIPTEYEAWQEVLRAPKQGEGMRVVEEDGRFVIEKWQHRFTHPFVETVARELGWPDRFPGGSDTEMADRAHFYKAYQAKIEQAITEQRRLPEVQEYLDQHNPHSQVKMLADRLRP